MNISRRGLSRNWNTYDYCITEVYQTFFMLKEILLKILQNVFRFYLEYHINKTMHLLFVIWTGQWFCLKKVNKQINTIFLI